MSYVDDVLALVEEKNPGQPEFLQAVKEVLESLRPVIEQDEEKYRREAGDLAQCDEDVLSYAMFPQVAKTFFEKREAKKTGAVEPTASSAPAPERELIVDTTGADIRM